MGLPLPSLLSRSLFLSTPSWRSAPRTPGFLSLFPLHPLLGVSSPDARVPNSPAPPPSPQEPSAQPCPDENQNRRRHRDPDPPLRAGACNRGRVRAGRRHRGAGVCGVGATCGPEGGRHAELKAPGGGVEETAFPAPHGRPPGRVQLHSSPLLPLGSPAPVAQGLGVEEPAEGGRTGQRGAAPAPEGQGRGGRLVGGDGEVVPTACGGIWGSAGDAVGCRAGPWLGSPR